MVQDAPPIAAPHIEHEESSGSWIAAALAVHAAGSAAVVAWLVIGGIAARRLRQASQPAPKELTDALRFIVGGERIPALLASTSVGTPVALGLRRPAIILPSSLAASSQTPRELESILAHEWAHIVHGDLYTLAASRVMLLLLWPQPMYWWLRRVIRLDQETLADAAAIEVADRVDYAAQLLAWARTATPRAPRLAAAVGLWESPSQLKRRVAALLDDKLTILRTCSGRWRMGSALGALAAACLLSLVTLQRDAAVAHASDGGAETSATAADNALAIVAPDAPMYIDPDPVIYEAATSPMFSVRCVDVTGKPLANVRLEVFQYLNADPAGSCVQRGATLTGGNGDHTFVSNRMIHPIAYRRTSGLPFEPGESTVVVVAYTKGRATTIQIRDAAELIAHGGAFELRMPVGVELRGVVLGPAGQPVPGAVVRLHEYALATVLPSENFLFARTDESGAFTIDDIAAFDGNLTGPAFNEALVAAGRDAQMNGEIHALNLLVSHPDFAAPVHFIKKIPADVSVRLERPAILQGQVVYDVSAPGPEPAVAVDVNVALVSHSAEGGQTIEPPAYMSKVRTDAEGRYRFGNAPAGKYDVFVSDGDWSDKKVVGIELRPDSVTEPEVARIPLVGGLVRVRLVDAAGAGIALPEHATALLLALSRDADGKHDGGRIQIQLTARGVGFLRALEEHTTLALASSRLDGDDASVILRSDDPVPVEVADGETIDSTVQVTPVAAPAIGADELRSPETEATDGQSVSEAAGDYGILNTLSPTWGNQVQVISDPTTFAATVPDSGDGAFDLKEPENGIVYRRANVDDTAPQATGANEQPAPEMEPAATGDGNETIHAGVGPGTFSTVRVGPATGGSSVGATPNRFLVRCLDEGGTPVAGVKATLYRVALREGRRELVGEGQSDAAGEVRFADIVPTERLEFYRRKSKAKEFDDAVWQFTMMVTLQREKLATTMVSQQELYVALSGQRLEVTLRPAYQLAGRVTSPDGQPVAGALVAVAAFASGLTIEGVNVVRTDADGRYVFHNRPKYDAAAGAKDSIRLCTMAAPLARSWPLRISSSPIPSSR